jgi:hypothetical protein
LRKTTPYIFIIFVFIVTALFAIPSAFAKGGGHSIGLGLGITSATQKDLNSVIDTVNTSTGANTKNLTSAYEFDVQYGYRFSGSIFGLVFRPSYFTASGKGSAGTTSYNYELSGYSFFPMIRLTPLENKFIKFFLQSGVGIGYMSGKVVQGVNEMTFAGSSFGASAGLGAEFCFTDNHCMTVEGNVRYLPIERNSANKLTGTMTGFSQAAAGREVEAGNNDMGTTMSGIQGRLAYTLNF